MKQTAKRVALYARRDSPGEPLPINIDPIQLNNVAPSDGEIWEAAGGLTNGRTAGASGMRAEDMKAWLHGIKLEEDPKVGPNNIRARDNWGKFVLLVQAIWDHGEIPPQLLWVIIVLIPKGGGDYPGIGLLEPMWKVCKCVIDLRLNAFELHDLLHGCRNACRTGMVGIVANFGSAVGSSRASTFLQGLPRSQESV